MTRKRHWLLSTTCLCAVAAFGPAQAADLPAVSDGYSPMAVPSSLPAVSRMNGKLSAFGGSQDGGLFGVTGSLSVPLGTAYGLQIDGMAGSGRGAAFYGVGGHLFWRDPARGLVGLYASDVSWDLRNGLTTGDDVGKVGVEGEAYLGRVSLEGRAAYQFGTHTGFAGKALLAYYPTDNLRLDGGVRYLEGPGAIGMVDAEWQPHVGSSWTVYGSGSFGDNYTQALGGLRYYFGDPGKSLIRRHREDDPGDTLHDDLNATTGSGSTFDVSDIRLKRDIVALARLDNGIGLYRYRYLWSDQLYVGVMAQEVAGIVPAAVVCGPDGYLRVDYRRLGLRLQTWEEWQAAASGADPFSGPGSGIGASMPIERSPPAQVWA